VWRVISWPRFDRCVTHVCMSASDNAATGSGRVGGRGQNTMGGARGARVHVDAPVRASTIVAHASLPSFVPTVLCGTH